MVRSTDRSRTEKRPVCRHLSQIKSLQGAISIGNTFNLELTNGASEPGDYLYRSGSFKWDVESGMWGISRVLRQGIRCKCKNFCQKTYACMCKTHQTK
ncbi:MAG: hypothetical protein PUD93_00155 [Lachnospiraceae bacterium]|nr:hypothetical protein [Lachnospiraceae bacterium]